MNKNLLIISLIAVGIVGAVSYSMHKGVMCTESIKSQLNKMVTIDQEWRSKIPHKSFNPETNPADADLKEKIRAIDRENTAALKAILAKTSKGWITISEFGKEADKNAWLLVQHADQDPGFQNKVLALLEHLCLEKETDCTNVAYLADRVAVAQGRPQKYGTQFKVQDGQIIFNDIENEVNVYALRAAKGMPSMEEYKRMAEEGYGLRK